MSYNPDWLTVRRVRLDMAGLTASAEIALPFDYCRLSQVMVLNPSRAWSGSPALGLGVSENGAELVAGTALAPVDDTGKMLSLPLISPTQLLSASKPLYWSITVADSGAVGAFVSVDILFVRVSPPLL